MFGKCIGAKRVAKEADSLGAFGGSVPLIGGKEFYCSLEKVFIDGGEVVRWGFTCNGRKNMSFS